MMRAFSLAEATAWLDAEVAGKPVSAAGVSFNGVSTDTRSLEPGQLFVALRGEQFDGHRFLGQAAGQGAVAAVVEQVDPEQMLPQLVVADSVQALARLASANRHESCARLIAITGSSGKTTVREMIGAILEAMGPSLVTRGNLNNHIGVPLTLFRLSPEHEYGAIELGASGLGEIAHTVALVRPQVAVLTNAGQAHLEGFGSYQNIIVAKGEIIDGVTEDGVVVLNRDDPAFEQWYQRAGPRRVVSVSRYGDPQADYQAEVRRVSEYGFYLEVSGPDSWQLSVSLNLPGEHNITNALLALAACRAMGAGNEALITGFAGIQAVEGRLQVVRLAADLTLIDDSYNANPASMKAAIDVLAARPGKRVAVLGSMAELGEASEELHSEIGAYAREKGIDRLLAVGDSGYAAGFGNNTETFQSHEQAIAAILDGRQGHVTVLVKGSRSSAMNRVAEGLQKKVNNTCCSG